MPVNEDTGGWSKSELYVRKELERLGDQQDKIFEKIEKISTDVVSIKTEQRIRGGAFGVAGGTLTVAIVEIIKFLGSR